MQPYDGYACGPCTPLKNEHYRQLLRMHMDIVQQIWNKHEWVEPTYFYWDLTAGPGISPVDKTPQAPLIFADEVICRDMPHQAVFFERSKDTCAALDANLSGYPKDFHGTIISGDHRERFLPEVHRLLRRPKACYYGMVYHDPTPCKEALATWKLLADVSTRVNLKYIDFLFYVSATFVKRIRQFTNLTLQQLLAPFAKQHCLVREPFGQDQWTFILLTN